MTCVGSPMCDEKETGSDANDERDEQKQNRRPGFFSGNESAFF